MVVRTHAELKQMLEEEYARLRAQLAHGGSRINEHVGYGNHMADDATEAFEQARDFSVRARVGDTLLEVEHALSKFESCRTVPLRLAPSKLASCRSAAVRSARFR